MALGNDNASLPPHFPWKPVKPAKRQHLLPLYCSLCGSLGCADSQVQKLDVHKKMLRDAKKSREIQGTVEKLKEIQRNTEEYKEIQKIAENVKK